MEHILDKCELLFESGQYKKVVGCCDDAIKIKKDVDAIKLKGIALYKMGAYQTALECFVQVLAEEPMNPEAMKGAGLCAYSLGKFKGAVDFFRGGFMLNPQDVELLFFQALSLMSLNEEKKARDAIELATVLDPGKVVQLLKTFHQEMGKTDADKAKLKEIGDTIKSMSDNVKKLKEIDKEK